MPTRDQRTLRQFHRLLVNTTIANVTTSYLWFALTFWLYLETRSVLATSLVGGSYMLLLAVMGVPFGSLVDRTKKYRVMVLATVVTAVTFGGAVLWYLVAPGDRVNKLDSPWLWGFLALVLAGGVVESLRGLALSTCVTLLVPEDQRANANGLVGMANGLGFAVTSIFSGLSVGLLGMGPTVVIAFGLTLASLLHLFTVKVPEPGIVHAEGVPKAVDFRGAWVAIVAIPGLLGLILFATLNNLLGGVFISLMDPYGLELVSVEVWGLMWGVLSMGFIVGGALVAKRGLGPAPLRTLLVANLVMWSIGILFTLRENVVVLAVGIFAYMILIPVAEASEQTVLQTVVPYATQGRVFGFAQTVELAATPASAFLVGPLAQFWVIPWMNSEGGRSALGWLLGDGQARGIALVFVMAGVAGLLLTSLAFASRAYRSLSEGYVRAVEAEIGAAVPPA